jgi:hypothetical protein
MRNLLDFIFANLIPIIVVVSIALRIIGGMRSQARKKAQVPGGHTGRVEEQVVEEEDYAGVWDRLKPDEESPPALAPGGSSGGNSDTGGPPPVQSEIRPLLMPASFPLPRRGPAPVPPLSVSPLFSPVLPAEPKEPEMETKQESVEARSVLLFFRRIESLSPLRRAVILAEIMGPPRGA